MSLTKEQKFEAVAGLYIGCIWASISAAMYSVANIAFSGLFHSTVIGTIVIGTGSLVYSAMAVLLLILLASIPFQVYKWLKLNRHKFKEV